MIPLLPASLLAIIIPVLSLLDSALSGATPPPSYTPPKYVAKGLVERVTGVPSLPERPVCSSYLGSPPGFDCRYALGFMSRRTTLAQYEPIGWRLGWRGPPNVNHVIDTEKTLPRAYSWGRCTIALNLKDNSDTPDHEVPSIIKYAAQQIIEGCVENSSKRIGGLFAKGLLSKIQILIYESPTPSSVRKYLNPILLSQNCEFDAAITQPGTPESSLDLISPGTPPLGIRDVKSCPDFRDDGSSGGGDDAGDTCGVSRYCRKDEDCCGDQGCGGLEKGKKGAGGEGGEKGGGWGVMFGTKLLETIMTCGVVSEI